MDGDLRKKNYGTDVQIDDKMSMIEKKTSMEASFMINECVTVTPSIVERGELHHNDVLYECGGDAKSGSNRWHCIGDKNVD